MLYASLVDQNVGPSKLMLFLAFCFDRISFNQPKAIGPSSEDISPRHRLLHRGLLDTYLLALIAFSE